MRRAVRQWWLDCTKSSMVSLLVVLFLCRCSRSMVQGPFPWLNPWHIPCKWWLFMPHPDKSNVCNVDRCWRQNSVSRSGLSSATDDGRGTLLLFTNPRSFSWDKHVNATSKGSNRFSLVGNWHSQTNSCNAEVPLWYVMAAPSIIIEAEVIDPKSTPSVIANVCKVRFWRRWHNESRGTHVSNNSTCWSDDTDARACTNSFHTNGREDCCWCNTYDVKESNKTTTRMVWLRGKDWMIDVNSSSSSNDVVNPNSVNVESL